MAHQSSDDLELPIRNKPISGPAVDRLETRKEDNDGDPFTADRLAKNFSVVRAAFVDSFKKILSGTARE